MTCPWFPLHMKDGKVTMCYHHHFSPELRSISNSALLTYLNTDTPSVHGFPSFNSTIIIWTAYFALPSIIMSNPDALKSVFKAPLELEMEYLTKPSHILKLQWSIQWLQSTRCKQCPIMALPIDPEPTPTVPTVVSKLTTPTFKDFAIAPIIPTDPLFPPHLWPKRPYHLGEDIMEVGRGSHLFRVEEWDDDYYWITCCMDYTGVKFAIWVGQNLVIDPNPQDMLSWLDRIFLNSFDGPKGCNIGDWEGDARCEGEASVGKGYVEWVVRDEGYGASRLVVQHHQSSHQVSPFWWFYGHFWHHSSWFGNWLTMTHPALRQFPTPHRVNSLDQVIFPSISYFSHDESLCFILLSIFFLIYHLICHVVLWWNFLEDSYDSLMSNHLQISEMLLSHSGFPSLKLDNLDYSIRICHQLSSRSRPLWLHHQS